MTYKGALDYIHTRNLYGKKDGLSGIIRLLDLMGHPENGMKFVHVTGTNGKGSTTAMIASVLETAGYKTGKFISPFILSFRERIQIDSEHIPEDELALLTEYVKTFCDIMEQEGKAPTEFEVVTAIALEWFKRSKCDCAVLEVGIGGTVDPTNIIPTPLVSVITSISHDHESILGGTLTEITEKKCGIIKERGITVSYPDQPYEALAVIMEAAANKGNSLIVGNKNAAVINRSDLYATNITYSGLTLDVPLLGRHQVLNAITAIDAVNALRTCRGMAISDDDIINGIAKVSFPARFEILSRDPLVILDGAHNPSGIEMLSSSLDILGGREIVAIIGASRGKKIADSLKGILPKFKSVICVSSSYDKKAIPADELREMVEQFAPSVSATGTREEAYKTALSQLGENGAILIFGSLYLASDMREIVLNANMPK